MCQGGDGNSDTAIYVSLTISWIFKLMPIKGHNVLKTERFFHKLGTTKVASVLCWKFPI